jgi:hypothetical protein
METMQTVRMTAQRRDSNMGGVYSRAYTAPIARSYHQLLPYAFKRFSVLTALRTAMPTLGYYATRPALPPSQKPALFTMNILPPMMTVWHHCVRKYLGDAVDVTVFDCSGKLDPAGLPGFRVRKFLNLYAATKCDEFLRHIARNRRIAWLCDDDIFFVGDRAVPLLLREFSVPGTASVSFRPRTWWHFDIGGKRIEPSGSYCIALDRTVFWEREHLTLAPADGNMHAAAGGKSRRYDTFDRANEILLQKGYRCAILPPAEREDCITGFTGMSGAVMLLRHFRHPDDLLRYYRAPDDHAWAGNVLPGTLSALLAICTIQDCHERITGKRYPLPSLPSRGELERLRDARRPFLRPELAEWFEEVERTGKRLQRAL